MTKKQFAAVWRRMHALWERETKDEALDQIRFDEYYRFFGHLSLSTIELMIDEAREILISYGKGIPEIAEFNEVLKPILKVREQFEDAAGEPDDRPLEVMRADAILMRLIQAATHLTILPPYSKRTGKEIDQVEQDAERKKAVSELAAGFVNNFELRDGALTEEQFFARLEGLPKKLIDAIKEQIQETEDVPF